MSDTAAPRPPAKPPYVLENAPKGKDALGKLPIMNQRKDPLDPFAQLADMSEGGDSYRAEAEESSNSWWNIFSSY